MSTNTSTKPSQTTTPHTPSVPDGKSELPTTIPDFPGPPTTPPPAAVQSPAVATTK
jgi:hypothetical protein